MKKEKIPFYNELVVPYHKLRAAQCARKWQFPARKMRVIGVTGTNGKTTTCFMIWKMLSEAGIKAGVMTTVGWGFKKINKQIEHMTTESCEILNRRISELSEAGVEVLVLEVTSHALAQGRIFGVPIEVAVMTNVTHEHFDYHRTFRRYLAAKLKLFRRAKFGVINADDGSFREFIGAMAGDFGFLGGSWAFGLKSEFGKKYVSYGIKNGDIRAFEVKLGVSGVDYAIYDINSDKSKDANHKRDTVRVRTQIPGEFNVYNSLATVGVGRYFGLSDKQIVKGIFALEGVEGRMNFVEAGQDFKVLVDYAHTPDAIEKVMKNMAEGLEDNNRGENVKHKSDKRSRAGVNEVRNIGRVIVVHGGAGRRDESTRKPRGEIIGKYADVFIVTEDDSRDEEPKLIAEEFLVGAKRAGMENLGERIADFNFNFDFDEAVKHKRDRGSKIGNIAKSGDNVKHKRVAGVILDRKEAIFKAIQIAKRGDIVLILGKGHEKTILRKDGAHEFEDLKVAKEGILARDKI